MIGQVRQNIYGAWLDGEATAMEALRSLCDSYEELDDTYKQFEIMREQTRKQIDHVVSTMDRQWVELKGFGIVRIAGDTTRSSYDTAALDALASDLAVDGHLDLAEQILRCKKTSTTRGSLRIEREKAAR